MHAEQVRTLAAYNRWMNERLYCACADIDDAERKRPRAAFFDSIHGTLNHLLLGDLLWLGRFTGQSVSFASLDQELHADFGQLRSARAQCDDDIDAWVASLDDAALAAPFRFKSVVNPRVRSCPLWVAVTHFFNHQTHHRGQLTTLLSQAGVDYGTTDLIWLPGLLHDED